MKTTSDLDLDVLSTACSAQEPPSLAPPRSPFRSFDQLSTTQPLGEVSAESEPTTLPAVPSAPAPSVREELFGVRLWCTGTILELDPEAGLFQCELVDDKGTRSLAEIDLDSVDPAERGWVVPGNRFTYVQFFEQRPSGLVNSDQVIVEPLRAWSQSDAARAAARPAEDLSFLDAE